MPSELTELNYEWRTGVQQMLADLLVKISRLEIEVDELKNANINQAAYIRELDQRTTGSILLG